MAQYVRTDEVIQAEIDRKYDELYKVNAERDELWSSSGAFPKGPDRAKAYDLQKRRKTLCTEIDDLEFEQANRNERIQLPDRVKQYMESHKLLKESLAMDEAALDGIQRTKAMIETLPVIEDAIKARIKASQQALLQLRHNSRTDYKECMYAVRVRVELGDPCPVCQAPLKILDGGVCEKGCVFHLISIANNFATMHKGPREGCLLCTLNEL